MKNKLAMLGLAALVSCSPVSSELPAKAPIVIKGDIPQKIALKLYDDHEKEELLNSASYLDVRKLRLALIDKEVDFAEEFDATKNDLPAVSADELYRELEGFMNLKNNREREYYGITLFLDAGYRNIGFGKFDLNWGKADIPWNSPEDEKAFSDGIYHNIIVTKTGESKKAIIIGAHLDRVKVGKGIIDNASGSVIVANLAQSLRHVETEYTYKFILFALEEKGLVGSEAYAQGMTDKGRDNFVYMMNYDCVGIKNNEILGDLSVPEISSALEKISRQRGFDVNVSKEFTWGSTDSESFLVAGLPASSLTGSNLWGRIHSEHDVIDRIDKAELAEAYRVALDLIYVSELSDF